MLNIFTHQTFFCLSSLSDTTAASSIKHWRLNHSHHQWVRNYMPGTILCALQSPMNAFGLTTTWNVDTVFITSWQIWEMWPRKLKEQRASEWRAGIWTQRVRLWMTVLAAGSLLFWGSTMASNILNTWPVRRGVRYGQPSHARQPTGRTKPVNHTLLPFPDSGYSPGIRLWSKRLFLCMYAPYLLASPSPGHPLSCWAKNPSGSATLSGSTGSLSGLSLFQERVLQ